MKSPSLSLRGLVVLLCVSGSAGFAQTPTAPAAANVAPEKPKEPPKWETMDYGPVISATIVAPVPAANITNKGIAIKVGAHGEGAVLFDTDLMRWSAGW